MRKKKFLPASYILPFFGLLCVLAGCGADSGGTDGPPVFSTPTVLVPEAAGEEVIDGGCVLLDISNLDQGYLVAANQDEEHKINIQLTALEQTTYSYFLDPGEEAVIPFTDGSGDYQLICYQEVEGSRYAALLSQNLSVELENEFLPFLYPNQYVNFTPESEASKLALSLVSDDATDSEGLDAIYDYVVSHLVYDDEKAANVDTGYLPDVDETLAEGKGICFDYAALTAAMLRSRDIPCKLQIGYAGDVKHAWIDVYLEEEGWVEGAIAFDGETWNRFDPTFASNSDDAEAIQSYIGDGSNYTVQFTR